MEQILDVYKRPYDENFPVVCMDESPKQLIEAIKEENMEPANVLQAHLEKKNGLITSTRDTGLLIFSWLTNL